MDKRAVKASELRHLERRDWQLWSIAIFLILALSFTIVGIYAPTLIDPPKNSSGQLVTLLSGLSLLVACFSTYVLHTIYTLKGLRQKLSDTELEKEQIQSLLETVTER